jgi:ABC-2 type transport system permease protein
VADEVSANEAFRLIASASGYIFLTLLAVGAIAFLLSVSTDAPLGAVGGAVMIFIVSSILDQIDALGSIRNVLPTHFSDAWVGLLSTPTQWDAMVKGAISALLFAVVVFSFAFWRFLRKDVVS